MPARHSRRAPKGCKAIRRATEGNLRLVPARLQLGRALETEALVGSILELARLTDTPAPSIQAVYACVKLLNKVMLTEGGGVRLNKAA